MRGIEAFNFPAFDAAAKRLRRFGHEVCSPAEHDRELYGQDFCPENAEQLGFDMRWALAWDLDWIARFAEAVAVLDGWEDSNGVQAEVALARALGIPVVHWKSNGWKFGLLPGDDVHPPAPSSLDELAENAEQRLLEFQNRDGEVRTTSSTGGEKGVKPARFELIPPRALFALAELYGEGAKKYEDRNWERGYEYSKSFGAMMRHAWLFWSGEDDDPGTGKPHMASVMFHAAALIEFLVTHPEFDDRPRDPEPIDWSAILPDYKRLYSGMEHA